MKYAIFADSPLHVLNCINLVWHNVEQMQGNCDLYIHKQFSGYDQMIPALRRTGLFSNIYECRMPVKSQETKLWHSIIRISELFLPGHFLRKWAGRPFQKNEYDILLMPAPLRFTVALADINKAAAVWFYEDGSANYFGNITDAYGPKSKYIIKKLFNKGHATIKPERMYLNNVSFSGTTTDCKVLGLPPVDVDDAAFMGALNDIFGESSSYSGKEVFYLSIPLPDISAGSDMNVEEMFTATLQPLVKHKARTIVRPHPREPERAYSGLDTDKDRTLWELTCARVIRNDHILIGSYSTGQLMPKILFNKEPFLIFLYKIYHPVLSKERIEAMDALIARIRSSYSDPSKVYNVGSIDEYRRIIEELLG